MDEDGFEILKGVVPAEECEDLAEELSLLHEQRRTSGGGKIGGLRNLLRIVPRVAELARSINVLGILEKCLSRKAFPVRALMFDKTVDANWRVTWHQDLTIAVADRIEAPGFENWSVKEGITHVQPPRELLETMITVRLHLDDCDATNGALKVIPGSHLRGKLRAAEVSSLVEQSREKACESPRGGVLLMRPLLVHSSSPALNPKHRRVLHVEYATEELPNGLKWFDC